jgi:hypothetical protein
MSGRVIPDIHVYLLPSRHGCQRRAGMAEGRASAKLLVCYFSQIFSGIGVRAGQFIVPE